jgi:hypothetical protein
MFAQATFYVDGGTSHWQRVDVVGDAAAPIGGQQPGWEALMDPKNLSAREFTAFMAGREDAAADKWRQWAESKERDGKDSAQCHRYADEAVAERDRLLAQLAT